MPPWVERMREDFYHRRPILSHLEFEEPYKIISIRPETADLQDQ
jgi:hypothetical protein